MHIRSGKLAGGVWFWSLFWAGIFLLTTFPLQAAGLSGIQNLQQLGDIDHDGQADLMGIHQDAQGRSELIAYELDPQGSLSEFWQFSLPENMVGRWSDATITDLNLNGRPEIIAVARIVTAAAAKSIPWLYGFEWDGQEFPYVPTFQWGLKAEQGLYARPGQVESADLDHDGLPELVIAQSGPEPRILILEFSGTLSAPAIEIEYDDLPAPISATPDPFTLAVHDVNDDGQADVAVFQKRGATLYAAELVATAEDTYTSHQQLELPLASDQPELIRPDAIAFADLEQSGHTGVYVGTTAGRIYRTDFSGSPGMISESRPVAARIWRSFPAPVEALQFTDDDGDGLSEVFLRSGENAFFVEQDRPGNMNFGDFVSLLDEEIFQADQVLPVNGSLLVDRDGEVELQTTALTPPPNPAVEVEATEEPTVSDSLEMTSPPEEVVSEKETIAPEGVTQETKPVYRRPRPADVVLHAGELFVHSIPRLDEMDPGNASVSFREYPEGMRLGKDFILRWNPTAEQLGYFTVSYTFGNLVDTTFTLYVNDVPIIYSSPTLLAVMGDQYLYQLQLEDLNTEKYFDFQLDTAPAGMALDEEGLLRWQPSDTQLDSQVVSIRVSDGFESVVQKFTLYVNIPPLVLEKPAPVAFVNEPYQGAVKFQDQNRDNTARLIPVRTPSGLVLESSGRITWTPEKDQTGFHDILYELTDDMASRLDSFTLFVNTPPKIISRYDEHVPVGKPWNYAVEVEDPNDNQDISFLLSESTIPNLSISRRGRITWTPTEADLGPQSFVVSVSDGMRDDLQKVDLYVNSPPRIGTTVDTLATLARPYATTIPVTDLNKGQPLKFSLLDAPKGMGITNTGEISWKPVKAQKGWNEVFVKVFDGYSSDTYQFRIYANAPPVIVSRPDSMAIVGDLFVYELKALDLNTDQDLLFQIVEAPEGVELVDGTMIHWTPAIDQINRRSFKVSVTDGYLSNVQTIDLFVDARPEVTSKPKEVVLTDRNFRYQLEARDLNADSISYHKVLLPAGAEMDEGLGLITWTPDAANEGENEFIIDVVDARGANTQHTFTVHVFKDPKTPLRQMGAFLITLAGIGAMFIIKFLY